VRAMSFFLRSVLFPFFCASFSCSLFGRSTREDRRKEAFKEAFKGAFKETHKEAYKEAYNKAYKEAS